MTVQGLVSDSKYATTRISKEKNARLFLRNRERRFFVSVVRRNFIRRQYKKIKDDKIFILESKIRKDNLVRRQDNQRNRGNALEFNRGLDGEHSDELNSGENQKTAKREPRGERGVKENKVQKERCILVGIATPKIRPWLATEQLAELGRLAETAGAEVVQSFLQRVQQFNAATLIGEGKVNQVKQALADNDAKMVVFDDDLSG